MPKKIVVSTEAELERIAKTSVFLLGKFIESFDIWKREYGSDNKNKMDNWRRISIDFLKNPENPISIPNGILPPIKKED